MRPGASTLTTCLCVPCTVATRGELSPELSMLPTPNMPRGAACCPLQSTLLCSCGVRAHQPWMHTAI